MQKLRGALQDRLYVLSAPSIEAYMPDVLYERAGRNRADDLGRLDQLQHNRVARDELKREISSDLAQVLQEVDLASIPTIVEAARRAIDEAT